MPEMLGNAVIFLTSAAAAAFVGNWIWSRITRDRHTPPRQP
jgi:hypothetical protein